MLGGPYMHCVLVHRAHIPATLTHLHTTHSTSWRLFATQVTLLCIYQGRHTLGLGMAGLCK